uniref:Exocyst complex component 8 n=2 Tax=Anthurium amnicola TaxID=1678845 RepID=A0A1D1XL22_9ARAE
MEQELIELQKHVSAQGILVQDLINGVCHEIEEWNKCSGVPAVAEELQVCDFEDLFPSEKEDAKVAFLENIDVLLAEHKTEEAIQALDEEEKTSIPANEAGKGISTDDSSYKEALLKRKAILVDQFFEIIEQPTVSNAELRTALSGLLKLGKGSQAHKLFLKKYGSRLLKSVEAFLPLCSVYSETYTATLSQLVFSTIALAAKESCAIFGDLPSYTNKIVQWAEYQIESFVRLVKENGPLSDSTSAFRSASICIEATLSHCLLLESQGLKFSKLVMVLLRPYMEEVLDMNFRRARRRILDFSGCDDAVLFSPPLGSPFSAAATSSILLANNGKKFMFIVVDILEQLTPMAILHFGANILNRLLVLFDKYVESLTKALPGPSEDDCTIEQKESVDLRVETDAQQLALLGTAFTVADEMLPAAVSRIFTLESKRKLAGNMPSESVGPVAISPVEFKDWRRHLQHSLDKLRDHFCRQYVLTFIYSREGKARLDPRMYLTGKTEDLFWDSDPLPSFPFQALFARLQQLASVARDVLIGKEKVQKILLARLMETVVMWLSDEQEFWDVFEDESFQLQPFGLQQLVLDMHFIVEIAVCGGYPSKNVHQTASAVIARAIETFSKRGVDPQSALPEDEWFVDTAKAAINKLLLGPPTSGSYELDEHIVLHDDISDSEGTPSSLSTVHSVESFASANMGETESPVYYSDPEA